MKRILTLTAAGLLAVACSNGPTGVHDPAPMNPEAVFSISLGPDVSSILNSAGDPQLPYLVAEAWEYQARENLYDQADTFADRIERLRPDLVEIRQTRLIPVAGESSLRGLPDTGAGVDFAEQLRKTLLARGLTYDVTGQQVEAELAVGMALDHLPLLPLRLVVCRAEMSPFVVDYPLPE